MLSRTAIACGRDKASEKGQITCVTRWLRSATYTRADGPLYASRISNRKHMPKEHMVRGSEEHRNRPAALALPELLARETSSNDA